MAPSTYRVPGLRSRDAVSASSSTHHASRPRRLSYTQIPHAPGRGRAVFETVGEDLGRCAEIELDDLHLGRVVGAQVVHVGGVVYEVGLWADRRDRVRRSELSDELPTVVVDSHRIGADDDRIDYIDVGLVGASGPDVLAIEGVEHDETCLVPDRRQGVGSTDLVVDIVVARRARPLVVLLRESHTGIAVDRLAHRGRWPGAVCR